jgi:hypothetical protein
MRYANLCHYRHCSDCCSSSGESHLSQQSLQRMRSRRHRTDRTEAEKNQEERCASHLQVAAMPVKHCDLDGDRDENLDIGALVSVQPS